jgi:hypothetical protein
MAFLRGQVWKERLIARSLDERPKVQSFDIVKSLLFPATLAALGFFLGQWSEQRKEITADERLAIENRTKVFNQTAVDFSTYATQFSRLRTIAAVEQGRKARKMQIADELAHIPVSAYRGAEQRKLKADLEGEAKAIDAILAEIADRKKRYVDGRDAAHDRLLADLVQARLFFSESLVACIEAFETFDTKQGSLNLKELAPIAQWQQHAKTIFSAMTEDIVREQDKKRSFVRRLWFFYSGVTPDANPCRRL